MCINFTYWGVLKEAHCGNGLRCHFPELICANLGHEDLQQDERLMQLFGAVNSLLTHNYKTAKSHLSVERHPFLYLENICLLCHWHTRYEAFPHSPNSSLIVWVLHSNIRLLNIEHQLMIQTNPNHDNLPLIWKVEIFEYLIPSFIFLTSTSLPSSSPLFFFFFLKLTRYALKSTSGCNLYNVLWYNYSSEMGLDQRTISTRSPITSMVGYDLGLGKRILSLFHRE